MIVTSLFSKSYIFKMFSVHTETPSRFSGLTSVFEKLRFCDGVHGRPDCRSKAVFLKSSSAEETSKLYLYRPARGGACYYSDARNYAWQGCVVQFRDIALLKTLICRRARCYKEAFQ